MRREKKQLLPLPESEFWQDEKRVKKAVELALKPL